MTKYLIKRVLRGLFSVVVVVAIVMLLVFSLTNRDDIFKSDSLYSKQKSNSRIVYKYVSWEKYGYLDYVPYADYLAMLVEKGEITAEESKAAAKVAPTSQTFWGGWTEDANSEKYIQQFIDYYTSKGYEIHRLDQFKAAKKDGAQRLFATKDIPVTTRIWKFFTSLIEIDNIHYAEKTTGEKLEGAGIRFTLFDPVYNTAEDGSLMNKKFSPALIGNGTKYKYLLYFDGNFPYLHQNLIRIHLGESFSIRKGKDVWDTMNESQGSSHEREVVFPSGYVASTNLDFHSVTYSAGSQSGSYESMRFVDDYTKAETMKRGNSKIGYSFIIGIFEVIIAYFIGIPIGLLMARKKDKLIDKIGTLYIIFIIAVPSLAYIFIFRAIGMAMKLPTTFDIDSKSLLIYVLPIMSLAMPAIGALMKWIRRYTIDQENSDYVKFARSGGLSEGEIFRKHILKNAIIPIVHGIPGSILGALVGAIIPERVFTVPGAGGMLTEAINALDNAAIIGITLFYAMLSITSLILGDILMATMDPRISFSDKGR